MIFLNLRFYFFQNQIKPRIFGIFDTKSDKIRRRTSIKQLNGVTKPYSKEVNTFSSFYVSVFLYVVVSLQ